MGREGNDSGSGKSRKDLSPRHWDKEEVGLINWI